MKKKNILITLGYLAVYLVIYLTGRIIWCDIGKSNFWGWLFTDIPTKEHSYLFGWLLSSYMFWYSLAISALPSLFGRFKFSAITTAGFILGFVSGVIFGPYPQGAAIGHGHYGWAIWGAIYLISIAAGVVIEICKRKVKSNK